MLNWYEVKEELQIIYEKLKTRNFNVNVLEFKLKNLIEQIESNIDDWK